MLQNKVVANQKFGIFTSVKPEGKHERVWLAVCPKGHTILAPIQMITTTNPTVCDRCLDEERDKLRGTKCV